MGLWFPDYDGDVTSRLQNRANVDKSVTRGTRLGGNEGERLHESCRIQAVIRLEFGFQERRLQGPDKLGTESVISLDLIQKLRERRRKKRRARRCAGFHTDLRNSPSEASGH
jgi:hypothetical protein